MTQCADLAAYPSPINTNGLERVAEELMGRTKWMVPGGAGPAEDWRPETAPSPAPLTPPASSCQTASTTPSVHHLPHQPVASGVGVWEGDCSSSGSSSPGPPGPWYMRPPDSPPDQPLDLSSKARSSPGPSQAPLRLPLPKHIFKAKPRISAVATRRAYTEDELQAALRDIQSGKLGTRRAAVIYGIPRSTLRNKVYKLSQERSLPKEDEDEEEESQDEDEKEVEKALSKPLLSMEDLMRLGGKALPYLQMLAAHESPELARMMAEEKRINGEMKKPSPPTSPPRPRPQASQASQTQDDKKPGTSKPNTGKGTRPKRGKYRNYDRDSLVEAVRAVQRGEMSVHRAGSFYGVPHSTLEYKVKERHLMRPRKREPKQQTSIHEEVKRKEEAEKRRAFAAPLPANGLLLNGLPYPSPYPFWPPYPLPLEYPRPELFPVLRLPEERASTSALGKTTREVAENLYDGTGENGSFLDGIIRSSLETGLPRDSLPKTALLEQLCRQQSVQVQAQAASPPPPAPPKSASPPKHS